MSRANGLEKMSYTQLMQMRHRIDQLIVEKQAEARTAVRDQVTALLKEHGMTVEDVFGKGRKGKGSVAVKYRDPKNAENTWTGRGRMPRWLVAATKGSKAKKEDYLV
jgi:DNA-binding protein H-NS